MDKVIEEALKNLDNMKSALCKLDEDASDEAAYQRLVSKSLKHSSLVSKLAEGVKEKQAYTVIRGDSDRPTFSVQDETATITFPAILKKSRRLTCPEDLKFIYEKYEKPIKEFFYQNEFNYGKKRVFWFEYHGWKGDCDNLETKAIIDLTSGYLVPDDTGKYVSIYQTAVEDDQTKTVLRIMTENDFKKELSHG